MALFELINLRKLRKAVLYIICIVAALWLQTMIFSRNGPLGVKPLFLPALIVVIGMFEGGVWGGLLGLLAGYFCDMNYSDSTVLFLILFSAYGFCSGLLTEFFINCRFLAYFLLTIFALLFTSFCQVLPFWIFRGTSLRLLAPIALLQSAWSLPFAVLFYFVVKHIAGRERDRL